MLKEFREFALKGNVMDMAVGIIIGAAFSAIVGSLVADVLMPPIGLILGNIDFANLFVLLKEGAQPGPYATVAEAKKAGAITINYGLLISTLVNFILVAFALFMVVRNINRLRREEAPAPPAPDTKECPHCISKIPAKATVCAYCTNRVG